MKLVYIAGPYRGPTKQDIESNIQDARAAAISVCKLGFYPVCPHLNTAHFDRYASDGFFLEGTAQLLLKCDAVLVLKGYERSAGTTSEIAMAEREGIPIAFTLEALDTIITDQEVKESDGLDAIIADIAYWQGDEPAFAGATVNSVLCHLASELGELCSALSPGDTGLFAEAFENGRQKRARGRPVEEVADVLFLLTQLVHKMEPSCLPNKTMTRECMRKLRINQARRWKAPDVNGVVEGAEESKG